jgi:hypothetical protein
MAIARAPDVCIVAVPHSAVAETMGATSMDRTAKDLSLGAFLAELKVAASELERARLLVEAVALEQATREALEDLTAAVSHAAKAKDAAKRAVHAGSAARADHAAACIFLESQEAAMRKAPEAGSYSAFAARADLARAERLRS